MGMRVDDTRAPTNEARASSLEPRRSRSLEIVRDTEMTHNATQRKGTQRVRLSRAAQRRAASAWT